MNASRKSLIDGHTHVGVDLLFYLRGHYPYAQDWSTLASQGAAAGIDRFVVFPMVTHLAFDIASLRTGRMTTDGGLERVPYGFENRRLMHEIFKLFPDTSDKALPFWMMDPSRAQEAQVAAMKQLGQRFPCSGLKIQATIIQSFIRDLLGPGACLLDYAAENGLPVLIHTSVGPEDPWSPVQDILAVARARPEVRFCLAHSCRFDEPSLDEVAALPNAWFDCSAHRIHCILAQGDSSEIAAKGRRCNFDYREPGAVLQGLATKYPSKLIWGSDAPFESYVDENISLHSTYPDEAATLHSLDKVTVDRIARANTLAFLAKTE
jgi:predicted TIM-barrel fold metal-dependent hydrolase